MHKCFLAFERNFQTHRLRSALVLCLKPTPRVIMKDLKCFGRDGSCLGAFLCLRSSMVSGTYNCTILAPLSPVTTTRLYKTKQSHKNWLHILGPVINIQEPPLFYFNTRSVLPLHIERGITRVFFYIFSRVGEEKMSGRWPSCHRNHATSGTGRRRLKSSDNSRLVLYWKVLLFTHAASELGYSP